MVSANTHLSRWLKKGLVFPLAFLNGWLLLMLVDNIQPLFGVLSVAILLALFLDIPIRQLQRRGLPRSGSIGLVLVMALLLAIALGLTLVPLLIGQLSELIDLLPAWASKSEAFLESLSASPPLQQLNIDIEEYEARIAQQLANTLQSVSGALLGVVTGALSSAINLFLTVVITIFLLVWGENAWNGILGWLPPCWEQRILELAPRTFRTFIGGQVSIAFGFGVVLAIVFTAIGVPLGILFGFVIGLGSLIPLMGAITQTAVSLFLAVQNIWTGIKVFAIAFAIGQVVDNVVSPRVMGNLVGLNPLWVIVSVFLGFKLSGIVGAFVAVPIAGMVKILTDDVMAQRAKRMAAQEPLPVLPIDEDSEVEEE